MPDEPTAAGALPPAGPPAPEPTAPQPPRRRDQPLVQRAIVSDALMDPDERERIGFDPSPEAPIPVVVELNLRHRNGLQGAADQFITQYRVALPGAPEPTGWPTPTTAAS